MISLLKNKHFFILLKLLSLALLFVSVTDAIAEETTSSSPPQWRFQNPLPTGNDLNSISFTDPNNGWLIDNMGNILYSRDGGKTWKVRTRRKSVYLRDILFTDKDNGWIVGGKGLILHTTDAGETWAEEKSGTENWLTSLFFTDKDNGWIVGGKGLILH
ncbi:MAG: WD40/YVTN/BNR-like repeat-containing protein, partial [Nitrospirota bacterium]